MDISTTLLREWTKHLFKYNFPEIDSSKVPHEREALIKLLDDLRYIEDNK